MRICHASHTFVSCYSCPWPLGLGGAGARPRTGSDCFYSVLFYIVWPMGLDGAGAGRRTGSNCFILNS